MHPEIHVMFHELVRESRRVCVVHIIISTAEV